MQVLCHYNHLVSDEQVQRLRWFSEYENTSPIDVIAELSQFLEMSSKQQMINFFLQKKNRKGFRIGILDMDSHVKSEYI
jgi:hypothetical protein